MQVSANSRVRFANFELNLSTGELRSNGNVTYLQEKPFRILSLLLEYPDQLVTREQLVQHLWPDGIFVDFDQSLNKAVNRLREALGDSAEQPRLIETLPRRGYRFIGQIEKPIPPEMGPGPGVVVSQPSAETSSRVRMHVGLGVLATLASGLGLWWMIMHRPGSNPLQDIKQRQLTFNSSENAVGSGVISPDGKLLAYSDVKGIHIEEIDTGQVRDLPHPDASQGTPQSLSLVTVWIRDGSGLVANLVLPGQPPSIWLISLPGGNRRKIRENALAWSVSHDGQWVVFGNNLDNLYYRELWIMHPDGSDAHKAFDADKDYAFGGADFSPDGRRLMYVNLILSAQRGGMTYQSRPTEGGPAVMAISELFPRVSVDWAWSPDGRIIHSLMDVAEHTCNFWQVRLDTKTGEPIEKAKQLTNWSGFRMDDPSFSADGKRLSYLRSSRESVLYLADLQPGGKTLTTPTRVTLNEGDNDPVGWPDDRTLIFVSDRNGHPQLFRQLAGNDTPEPLTSKLDDGSYDARLSPDGAWIFYLVDPGDWRGGTARAINLMKVRVGGGDKQFVLRSTVNSDPSIRCARNPSTRCALMEKTPDQNQLIFTEVDSSRGRGSELARFPIESTPDAHYSWDLSPDGTRIAVLKESESKVHVISLAETSNQEILVKSLPKLYGLDWSADSRGLFVSALENDGYTLVQVDGKGQGNPLWHLKGTPQEPGDVFRMRKMAPRAVSSPDGRHIEIQTWNVSANIWMIENF